MTSSDTWFDAKQAAARQARLHRAYSKLKAEPPLAPVNPHPPRLMGEAEIAELYHGRPAAAYPSMVFP